MAHLYHLPELPPPGPALLQGPTAHHLLKVLRSREGDHIPLGDGRGRTADAVVTATARDRLEVLVGEPAAHEPLRPALTLAFACPRQARADWLIEHATEVGVARFQPLWTERSRPQRLRLDRWQKIAAAAAGQCARAWLPQIDEPVDLDAFLAAPPPGHRVLADADGSPAEPLDAAGDTSVLLVGPEGGLAPAERERALAGGFEPRRLAAHVLRTETAALVGAAVLLQHARPASGD